MMILDNISFLGAGPLRQCYHNEFMDWKNCGWYSPSNLVFSRCKACCWEFNPSLVPLSLFISSLFKTQIPSKLSFAILFYFMQISLYFNTTLHLPILQEDSDPSSPVPSSGQKLNYQTDPRPHFGVAWSSHSPCRPLWGSEGPCWGQRNQEVPNQTHTCPHCHLGLPPDTLRWHEVVNAHGHK